MIAYFDSLSGTLWKEWNYRKNGQKISDNWKHLNVNYLEWEET